MISRAKGPTGRLAPRIVAVEERMIRLFIAWPIPACAEQELARIIGLLRQEGGQVSWVKPKNIHLTARFLGDSDETLIGRLCESIDRVAARSAIASLTFDALGAFPTSARPRVIWAGLTGNIGLLRATVDLLEREVCELGFPPEHKAFHPHLTLGRVRQPRGTAGLMAAAQRLRAAAAPFSLDRLVLFRSTLTPQGSIYEPLHEQRLVIPSTASD